MKSMRIVTAILIALFLGTAMADEVADKQLAQSAGEAWLKSIDGGQYAASYDSAASMFKRALTKDKWSEALNAARTPLGELKSRKLASASYTTTLPGVPDGKYVLMQFTSSFQHKKEAVETLTMALGDDGQWRAAGYFIK